ncbi:MAG TPA: chlorophyllide reductase subunit Y, partial [Gammaproteobacteria bacterium]|nr:chlorophyllide reductase subunit Y [Gammaproteobacteria bacterium]
MTETTDNRMQGLEASGTAANDAPAEPIEQAAAKAAAEGGCHGGKETMQAAAREAGKSATLDKLAEDYPTGPHDQPQSMCPAFGSL